MQYSEQELIELNERADAANDARCNRDTRGHVWKINKRGHVEIHAGEFHNNITCAKCGYVYCIACYNRPSKDCTG